MPRQVSYLVQEFWINAQKRPKKLVTSHGKMQTKNGENGKVHVRLSPSGRGIMPAESAEKVLLLPPSPSPFFFAAGVVPQGVGGIKGRRRRKGALWGLVYGKKGTEE